MRIIVKPLNWVAENGGWTAYIPGDYYQHEKIFLAKLLFLKNDKVIIVQSITERPYYHPTKNLIFDTLLEAKKEIDTLYENIINNCSEDVKF